MVSDGPIEFLKNLILTSHLVTRFFRTILGTVFVILYSLHLYKIWLKSQKKWTRFWRILLLSCWNQFGLILFQIIFRTELIVQDGFYAQAHLKTMKEQVWFQLQMYSTAIVAWKILKTKHHASSFCLFRFSIWLSWLSIYTYYYWTIIPIECKNI